METLLFRIYNPKAVAGDLQDIPDYHDSSAKSTFIFLSRHFPSGASVPQDHSCLNNLAGLRPEFKELKLYIFDNSFKPSSIRFEICTIGITNYKSPRCIGLYYSAGSLIIYNLLFFIVCSNPIRLIYFECARTRLR